MDPQLRLDKVTVTCLSGVPSHARQGTGAEGCQTPKPSTGLLSTPLPNAHREGGPRLGLRPWGLSRTLTLGGQGAPVRSPTAVLRSRAPTRSAMGSKQYLPQPQHRTNACLSTQTHHPPTELVHPLPRRRIPSSKTRPVSTDIWYPACLLLLRGPCEHMH